MCRKLLQIRNSPPKRLATLISSHFKHKISTKGPRYFMGELFLIWNFVNAPLENDYATLISDHLAI